MTARGELIGALSFGDATRLFSPDQVGIAREVAAQMAIAIAQAQLYERVKRQAVELEQRVQDRTRELEVANQELDAFSYSISHDLRAPLRAMQGFTEALLEDYGARLDASGQDYAQRIVAASRRMDLLIQDLLAYSRLSRTEVQLETVSVETVVDEVCAQLATELKSRGAEIGIDRRLGRVMAHRAVFGQVLTNLLSNAVKFVSPAARPESGSGPMFAAIGCGCGWRTMGSGFRPSTTSASSGRSSVSTGWSNIPEPVSAWPSFRGESPGSAAGSGSNRLPPGGAGSGWSSRARRLETRSRRSCHSAAGRSN